MTESTPESTAEFEVRTDRRGTVSTAILKAIAYCSFEKFSMLLLSICGIYFLNDPLNSKVQVRSLCVVMVVRLFVTAEKRAVQFGAVNRYHDEQKEATERVIAAAKIADKMKKETRKDTADKKEK
jgi:hypothetical protein